MSYPQAGEYNMFPNKQTKSMSPQHECNTTGWNVQRYYTTQLSESTSALEYMVSMIIY